MGDVLYNDWLSQRLQEGMDKLQGGKIELSEQEWRENIIGGDWWATESTGFTTPRRLSSSAVQLGSETERTVFEESLVRASSSSSPSLSPSTKPRSVNSRDGLAALA